MTFETVTRIAFGITLALSATLIFVPGVILWLFQLAGEASTYVMARRAGGLFLGISALAFVTMDSEHAETRRAVSLCFLVMMAFLALLGLFEFIRGAVGGGIFLAIVVEMFFAYYYLLFWRD